MKAKVGIIGAAGYTAGELIRVLLRHPEVEIRCVQSKSQAGKKITEIHQDLVGETELIFQSEVEVCEINFLCKGHGESQRIIADRPELMDKLVIDLSQDFRLPGEHAFHYGLPEWNKDKIAGARLVANPGCFAASIQLALLPAVAAGLVDSDVHVSGITGSTGAGQGFSMTSHYSWRHGNASAYKALEHQHLLEIGETVQQVNHDFDHEINFIPYRGAFTRGIITTSYFQTSAALSELQAVYSSYYQQAVFTHLVDRNPDVKLVVNTNKCLIFPTIVRGKAVIVSVLDNLLKGAVGQAVQNMNIMKGYDETSGLKLKSTAF